jgi:hypothetical protein
MSDTLLNIALAVGFLGILLVGVGISRFFCDKPIRLKQGTVSVLFGCHSIIHSFFVLIAWNRMYGRWPKFWQIICILIHDIGHWGTDYLDNYEEKKKHWVLGAEFGKKLFGQKAYEFLAGHCSHSGYPKSKLYKADKYSWYIAPEWWLYSNTIFEPALRMGMGRMEAVKTFKSQVRKSIESGEFRSTHSMYLDRCQER